MPNSNMDDINMKGLGRRSLRLFNISKDKKPIKPLGVCNSQTSFERHSFYNSLQKSPASVRRALFETNSKENNDDSTLGTEIFSNRENIGRSPLLPAKHSDAFQERQVKPRRSMLGHRSKSKLGQDAPFKMPKPLTKCPSSSDERHDNCGNNGNLKPSLRDSCSTPLITPFDSDDPDGSSFFNKGISDNTWSVFKPTNQRSAYEAPVTRGSLLAGKARGLFVSGSDNDVKNNFSKRFQTSSFNNSSKSNFSLNPVEREKKLKWLSQKFQEEEESAQSYQEYSSESGNDLHKDYQENKSDSSLNHSSEESASSIKINNHSDLGNISEESSNSTDSYVQNETTILKSVKRNLEKCDKQSIPGVNEHINLNGDINFHVSRNNECFMGNPDFFALFEDLKDEKEDMDRKWDDFTKQREVFEKKWNFLNSVVDNYRGRQISSEKRGVSLYSSKKKPRKVSSSKVRCSFVSSPKSCLMLPRSSKMSSSKICTDLQFNLNLVETPCTSSRGLKNIKSLNMCYTPNTLSVMVDDQEKEIFGGT